MKKIYLIFFLFVCHLSRNISDTPTKLMLILCFLFLFSTFNKLYLTFSSTEHLFYIYFNWPFRPHCTMRSLRFPRHLSLWETYLCRWINRILWESGSFRYIARRFFLVFIWITLVIYKTLKKSKRNIKTIFTFSWGFLMCTIRLNGKCICLGRLWNQ